jgi:hypothetical protein
MGPDQRKKVEMLHNCTYGCAIGVFVDGKPMKKKDVDYTLLKRQFMTVHKPASTTTAPVNDDGQRSIHMPQHRGGTERGLRKPRDRTDLLLS